MKYIYFITSIFVLCWGPYLDIGIGYFADTQFAMALFIIIFGVTSWKYTPKEVKWVITILLILAAYVVFCNIGYDQLIYVPVFRNIRAACILYSCWLITRSIYKKYQNEAEQVFMAILFFGVVAHGVLMLLQFQFSNFREAITAWTFASKGLDINLRTRMPGFTNGGGAQLSLYMSMGLLLFPYCYSASTKKIARLFLAIGMAIVALSIVLCGRSGVYTAIFILPLNIFIVARYSMNTTSITGVVKSLLGFALICIVCVGSLFVLDSNLRKGKGGDDYAKYAFRRNLDMFLNPDEGIIVNETVVYLYNDHLMLPNDVKTFFLGDLRNMMHNQGAGGVVARITNSDMGYVRLWFSYGLFGLGIHLLVYVGMIHISWRFRRHNEIMASISIMLLLLIVIFNLKEIFFFTRNGWSITGLLFCATICSYRTRNSMRLIKSKHPSRFRMAKGAA